MVVYISVSFVHCGLPTLRSEGRQITLLISVSYPGPYVRIGKKIRIRSGKFGSGFVKKTTTNCTSTSNIFYIYYFASVFRIRISFQIRISFHTDPDPGSQTPNFYSDPDPRGVKIK